MTKKFLLTLALAALTLTAGAQQARKDIRQNVNLAGSNYVAYPGPQRQLTAAPKGYEPFYISHYGRHGSRYLIGTNDYDKPYTMLLRADSLGKLTPKGRDVLAKVKLIRQEAQQRDGELTLLGAQQHRGIARRMVERFPQVFSGATDIDARSTIIIRCILSMENELQQMASMNPKLRISHDASMADMWYLNSSTNPYQRMRNNKAVSEATNAFDAHHNNWAHLMTVLFNDPDYAKQINAGSLARHLFTLASNVQSTELRHQLSLWDIFTEDEVYDFWLKENAGWYSYYGPNRLNNGAGMYTQEQLLRNIISTADTCITKPHPGATLRFGHEVCVMPLVCLLDLNHYGEPVDSLEQLDDRAWNNYQIFPMACNVQFIFYKPVKGDLRTADILVKVLLNEDEATLPVATDRAPYYHWRDVRAYYLKQLDDYHQKYAEKASDKR